LDSKEYHEKELIYRSCQAPPAANASPLPCGDDIQP
jgi:hypothetical protein